MAVQIKLVCMQYLFRRARARAGGVWVDQKFVSTITKVMYRINPFQHTHTRNQILYHITLSLQYQNTSVDQKFVSSTNRGTIPWRSVSTYTYTYRILYHIAHFPLETPKRAKGSQLLLHRVSFSEHHLFAPISHVIDMEIELIVLAVTYFPMQVINRRDNTGW